MAEGDKVELDKVLLIGDGDNITVGKPIVDGARVMAIAREHGRAKKIIVFKFKAKVRYRRKNGHRQHFTALDIEQILPPGVEARKTTVAKPKTAAAKPEVTEPVAEKPAVEKTAAKTTAAKPKAAKPAAKTTTAKTAAPEATASDTTEPKTVKKTAPRKKKEETTEDGS